MSPGVCGQRGAVAAFREKGVQFGNYLCALADGSGYALDRTRAYITDCEYTGQVGFERPVDVCAGAHKAFVIDHDARPSQPVGIWIRADECKKVADRKLPLVTGSMGATVDSFEDPVLPCESGDRRLGQDFDVRPCGNPLDEIARHILFETGSTNDQPNFGNLTR